MTQRNNLPPHEDALLRLECLRMANGVMALAECLYVFAVGADLKTVKEKPETPHLALNSWIEWAPAPWSGTAPQQPPEFYGSAKAIAKSARKAAKALQKASRGSRHA